MRYFYCLLLIICVNVLAKAQDRILTLHGDEIICKVTEIDSVSARYKLKDTATNAFSGEGREIKLSEIFMITYENGTKDVFVKNLPQEKNKTVEITKDSIEEISPGELYQLGRTDAQLHYNGTKAFLTGGLCGVIFGYGFIPAVVVAAVPPKPDFSNVSEPNLIYHQPYVEGYKSKAHGRKALNVTGGFVSGIALDLLLLAFVFGL